jgi:MFS family permease
VRLLPDIRGLPRPYWFLFAGAFLNKLGGFVMILLAFYLKDVRSLSVEGAGFVVSLYGAGSFVAAPVGGALADRIGRRRTLVASMLLGAAAMLHLGAASTPAHIALAAFLMGFCCDMYRPAMSAAVADLVPAADRKRAFGLVYWAVNLGFAASAFLAGALAKVSFGWIFACDAATSVLFAAAVLMGVPETKPTALASGESKSGAGAPYLDRPFMAFVGVNFLVILVFTQGYAALPLDMAAHGVDAATFGWLVGINGVLIVLFQPIASHRLANARHDRTLAAAALLIGAGMGMNAIAASPLWYAIGVMLWSAGEIVMAPVAPAVAAEIAPAAQRGAYQGAMQLAWGGSMFLAPLLGSLVLGRLGSVALWTTCLAVCVAAAAGHVAMGRLVRRRIAEAAATV